MSLPTTAVNPSFSNSARAASGSSASQMVISGRAKIFLSSAIDNSLSQAQMQNVAAIILRRNMGVSMPTIRRKKASDPREFIAELNRAIGDNIRKARLYFEKRGILVDIVPHKTTLNLTKPATMDFNEFKRIVRKSVQPKIGSVLLVSKTTGNVFVCNNKGNRPGKFVLV